MHIVRSSIFIVFIALCLRLAYVIALPLPPVTGDAGEYDMIAVNIAAGHGFAKVPDIPTPVRAPLYPFFLGAVYAVFGHSYFAVTLIQSLLGALVCWAAFGIGKIIFNETVAVLAAWMTCLYPVMIAYSNFILSEVLFTFLFIFSIFYLLRALAGRCLPDGLMAGVLMGLATLTRPTTMILPEGLAAVALAAMIARKLLAQRYAVSAVQATRKILLILAVYLVASVAMIVPWTIRNYAAFGEFVPVATGGGFGIWTTGYAVSHNVSWPAAIDASHRRFAAIMGEPARGAAGVHPRIVLDRTLMGEAQAMLKGNRLRHFELMAQRLPRFWLTSHSSVFGIERSAQDYRNEGKYHLIVLRLLLLALQGGALALCIAGALMAFKRYPLADMIIITLVYFSGHIVFDPCPRYHVPVLPLVFVLSSFALVYIAAARGKEIH